MKYISISLLLWILVLFQCKVIFHCKCREIESDSGKLENSLHITHSGMRVPKTILGSSLKGVPEKEWNNYLLVAHGKGEDITLVTSTAMHQMAGSFHEKHYIQNSGKNGRNELKIFLDRAKISNYNFSYFSHTSDQARILTDGDGKMFAGSLNGSYIFPLLANENDSLKRVFMYGNKDINFKTNDLSKGKHQHSLVRRGVNTNCDPEKDDPLVLNIAITINSDLCKAFIYDKDYLFAASADLVHMAMIPFHRQTCLLHKIVHLSAFCFSDEDPYTRRPGPLIENLRYKWESKELEIPMRESDAVLLLVQNRRASEWGGADQSGICTDRKFAWSVFSYGSLSISHNLGHILGATDTGTNDPSVDYTYHSIMSDLNSWSASFLTYSINEMRHLIRKQGYCLLDDHSADRHNIISKDTRVCTWLVNEPYVTYKIRDIGWVDVGTNSVSFGGSQVLIKGEIYHGSFEIVIKLYVLNDDYLVQSYRRHVTTFDGKPPTSQNWGPSVMGFKENIFSFGATGKIQTFWKWNEISRPNEWKTCCDHRLTVYFSLRLCKYREKKCGTVNTEFSIPKITCDKTLRFSKNNLLKRIK